MSSKALINAMERVDDRIYAVGEHGIIIYSDDLGDNWTQSENVPFTNTLTDKDWISKKEYCTKDEFNNFIIQLENFYEACFQSNTQFYLLIDLNQVGMLPYTYIKQLSDFFINKKAYTFKLVICSSIIINNVAIRTLINGFFMIYTTIKPTKFVKTNEEAYEFYNTITPGDTMNVNDIY